MLKIWQLRNKTIHKEDMGIVTKNHIGAIKELYPNVIAVWYKLKMFQIFDIQSGAILFKHLKSDLMTNSYKHGYFGYQNAIALGGNQILFIEQNKEERSTVLKIQKDQDYIKKELIPHKSKPVDRIKVVNFLRLGIFSA